MRLTKKYKSALELANLAGVDCSGDSDRLYRRLAYEGYEWGTEKQVWHDVATKCHYCDSRSVHYVCPNCLDFVSGGIKFGRMPDDIGHVRFHRLLASKSFCERNKLWTQFQQPEFVGMSEYVGEHSEPFKLYNIATGDWDFWHDEPIRAACSRLDDLISLDDTNTLSYYRDIRLEHVNLKYCTPLKTIAMEFAKYPELKGLFARNVGIIKLVGEYENSESEAADMPSWLREIFGTA